MRDVRVLTNLVCNQNCTYCTSRSEGDPRAFLRREAVEQRVVDALSQGREVHEVVLTGGEPALRKDLPALVAFVRSRGLAVALETNATLLDDTAATALAAAGLARARVNLSGWGDALDAVTRDPGGFAATLRGVKSLLRAGIRVDLTAALVRSTAALLPALPAEMAAHWPGELPVRAIEVTVPVHSPDPGELLRYEDAVPVLLSLDRAARAVGIAVKIAPASGPPPCVFPAKQRPAHVYALTPGAARNERFSQVEACASCVAQDRCPGFDRAYLEREGTPALTPITEDRVRRRLSLIHHVDDQIRRELVTVNRSYTPDGAPLLEEIVRVNFQCNQSCRFCFVSTHLPTAQEQVIRDAIVSAAGRGASVVLSGGEPSLNANLVEYVKLARAHSTQPIQLQTNAVLLDDPARVRALKEAGLSLAFVSLHGCTAEVSDEVTQAPGTFVRSVVGLDHLVAAGLSVVINFVICGTNAHELPALVHMVADRWQGAMLNISFVAPSTDVVPRDREMIPRYRDVMPAVSEAMERAKARGVRVLGFESMCGIPLCMVPGDVAPFFSLEQVPPGYDGGEFFYPPACEPCGLKGRCFGVRRGYAALHGTGEVRAVLAPA